MDSQNAPPWDHYERKFVTRENRTLIHSTCRECGAVIIGEGLDTLLADEDQHMLECHEESRPRQLSRAQ